MSEEPLGARLRRERERRKIALSSICANSKINVALFEGLERGDVSRWPSGIFRRSFIRAYAVGIGLDPDVVTREFLECYPDPAVPLTTTDAGPPSMSATPVAPATAGIRLTLADPGAPFLGGRVLIDMRRRWAAVGCDAGIVVVIAAVLFVACGKFWLPLGITMLSYYLGGILVLGNTPGVCLWAPTTGQAPARGTIVTVHATLSRSLVKLRTRLSGATSGREGQRTVQSEARASRL